MSIHHEKSEIVHVYAHVRLQCSRLARKTTYPTPRLTTSLSPKEWLLVVLTTPMVSSLSLLILTVQAVLNIVLLGVTTLLNTILTSLALGVSGL